MSLFDIVTRNLQNPQIPISSQSILQYLGANMRSASGKTVTVSNAMTMSAVFRAVSILSGTGGALPFKTFSFGERDETSAQIVVDPHPDMPANEFWGLTIAHLATWGNFYAVKVRGTDTGAIRQLLPVHPDRVSTQKADNPWGKQFKISRAERNADGTLSDSDRATILTPNEIFHVPALTLNGLGGMSPIAAAREAIGAGLSTEQYAASLWANGALAGGVLHTEQRLDEEKATELKKRWQDRVAGVDNAHDIAVLDSGLDFKQLSIPPQDAQFIETRRFQVTEIARFYGIPPHLLAETDRSTSWGTGIEVQGTGFVTYTLAPGYLNRIEARVTKELLGPNEFAEFQVQGLMRGDSKTRAQYYQTMHNIGALTVNEIRALENLPALEEVPSPESGEDASRLPLSDSDE